MNKLKAAQWEKWIIPLKRIFLFIFHPERWIEWVQALILDLKYGKYLGGRVSNGNAGRGWFGSQNSSYKSLSIIFDQIPIKEDDIIVDVGCGKGRVFNWFLNRGFKNKLIGIEVDVDIATLTRERLRKQKQINILIGAVEDGILPDEGTIFYLGNPFSEKIVKNFADQLEKKIKQGNYHKKDRPIIVYNHCSRLHVFEENPFWTIDKLGFLTYRKVPAAIISRNAMIVPSS